MGRESIGQCGTSDASTRWCLTQMEMAILYLKHVCGPPPRGCEVEITGNDHELGTYYDISLTWDGPGTLGATEEKYIRKCELALEIFDEVMPWSDLDPIEVRQRLQEARERES